MDNTITLKFFRVQKAQGHCIAFETALRTAYDLGSPIDREKNINAGFPDPIIVRLEQLHTHNGFISGELIRKQISNIPPEANDDGLSPINLSDGAGLGLSSAFRYHIPTQVLLIQANNHGVSQNRLSLYLKCVDQNAEYDFDPIVRQDAWNRFNNGMPRRLTVKIASPAHIAALSSLGGATDAVGTGVANIGEALRGAYITLDVSMGTKKGNLLKGATEQVLRTLRRLTGTGDGQIDVRSLSVIMATDDGADSIDFLNECLMEKERLDLPEGNPERNYQMRAELLATKFQDHLSFLHRIYGQAA